MKTIHLLFSLITIIGITVIVGRLEPDTPRAYAESSHVEAVEASKKPEPAVTPPPPPAAAPARVLTVRQQLMQQAGIPEPEWPIVEDVVAKESGWCATKWEGEIGYCPAYHGVPAKVGYGLCQSTPAHKMAVMGEGWQTDPVKQLKWCHNYAQKYGSWGAAKKFRDCLGSCYSPRTHTTEFKRTTWF